MGDARQEYADIFYHEHHVSKKHKQMSRINRAAQFSPFAALTGYDDLVNEAARYTGQKRELDEEEKAIINQKLLYIVNQVETPDATFEYFAHDIKKNGGVYVSITGKLLKYDPIGKEIFLEDGTTIFIEDLYSIDVDF